MDIRLSDAEKIYLIQGCQENYRNDGRSRTDFRPVVVECGVLSSTDGSARVRLDDTDLLIGVKTELKIVENSSKEINRIQFSVDCSANASPQFEGKGGDSFAEEIAQALTAAYDNDYVLPDISRLIISPNHIWRIYVDVVILSYGGSIIDAASIGVKAALNDTHIPVLSIHPADAKKVTAELPDSGETFRLDLSRAPIIVCVTKIGSVNVVDCSMDEEVCARSSLWIAACLPADDSSLDSCILPLVRQAAGGSLERESIDEMLEIATSVACRLHKSLNTRLAAENVEARPPPGSSFLL